MAPGPSSAPLVDEPLIELSGHSAAASGYYLGRNTLDEFGKSVQLLVLVGLAETGIVSLSPLDGARVISMRVIRNRGFSPVGS